MSEPEFDAIEAAFPPFPPQTDSFISRSWTFTLKFPGGSSVVETVSFQRRTEAEKGEDRKRDGMYLGTWQRYAGNQNTRTAIAVAHPSGFYSLCFFTPEWPPQRVWAALCWPDEATVSAEELRMKGYCFDMSGLGTPRWGLMTGTSPKDPAPKS